MTIEAHPHIADCWVDSERPERGEFWGRPGMTAAEVEVAWVDAEAPHAPTLDELQAEARASIIAAIDGVTAAILGAYPASERLGWDAKAAEAVAVLAAGEAATLALAPLLVAECVAEYGAADDVARLAQLTSKAGTVAAKAAAWGELMATLSGLRGRAFAAIGAAEDEAGVQAALDAALAEIAGAQAAA